MLSSSADEEDCPQEPAPDPSDFPGNFSYRKSETGIGEKCRVHYLDHAGTTLFSTEQMQQAVDSMSQLHLNPHTCARPSPCIMPMPCALSMWINPVIEGRLIAPACSSNSATESSSQWARQQVLAFLNAPPGQYDVIFTSGATGSLQLFAQSFDWCGAQFLYTVANHTYVPTVIKQCCPQRREPLE